MLYVLKAKLDKAAGHLDHLRSVAKKKQMGHLKSMDDVSVQEVVVRDLHTQREQAKLNVVLGFNAGSATGEPRDGPEIESEEEDMSDVDPDLTPAGWALASDRPNATPSASASADPALRPPAASGVGDAVARQDTL